MKRDHTSRVVRCTSVARNGRALVECIVAIFLLGVTALSMGATVRGTLAAADDASLTGRAQAQATTQIEDALSRPCGTAGGGSRSRSRVDMLWQQSGASRSTLVHLDFELHRSPLAGHALPIRFSVDAGGVCP